MRVTNENAVYVLDRMEKRMKIIYKYIRRENVFG